MKTATINDQEADAILTWLEIAEDQHLGIGDENERSFVLKLFDSFQELRSKHPLLWKMCKQEPIMNDEAVLMKAGWNVECWSPFEIRHFNGSSASRDAAHLVLNHLRENKYPLEMDD